MLTSSLHVKNLFLLFFVLTFQNVLAFLEVFSLQSAIDVAVRTATTCVSVGKE